MGQTNAGARARLIEIIKTRSFESGSQRQLVSGRSTTFYFNMKATMLHPEGARLIATLILDALPGAGGVAAIEGAGAEADYIGGLEMGAVPIAAAVAALSAERGRPIAGFFVRKQPKDHGTRSLVEGLAPGETLQAKRVVIVEDVTTTGGSALKAVEAVRAAGAKVARVLTIVDRREGAAETFARAGLPFTPLLTVDDFR